MNTTSATQVTVIIYFARKAAVRVAVPAVSCLDDAARLLRQHARATNVQMLHYDDPTQPYDGARRQSWTHLTQRADFIICGVHDRAWLEANASDYPRLANILAVAS